MRRFKKLIQLSLIAGVPFAALACGDDEGSDNPGSGGSGGSSASGGSAGSGTGGTATGGTGGTATGGTGGTATGGTGGTATGGTGGTATGGTAGGSTGGTAGSGTGGTGGTGQVTCDLSGAGKAKETISGDITANRTLTADKVWQLSGTVHVNSGVTLTVEPCTRIEGLSNPLAVLIVKPGAKLEAPGTADQPILFTSSKAVGQRASADWMGVVLLGNATANYANGGTADFEAIAGETFGGSDSSKDTESSGTLTYVRIEFVGNVIAPDKEVNGLTFAGVGSGTTVSHVMVSNSADDCFEWFGGAANADHLVCYNNDDDMFDVDTGYHGKLQYLFGKSTASSEGENAIESGDDKDNNTRTPLTTPTMYNVTLCGEGAASASGQKRNGAAFRGGTKGTFVNVIASGFYDNVFRFVNFPGDATSGESNAVLQHWRGVGSQAISDKQFGLDVWATAGADNSQADPGIDCNTNFPAPAAMIAGGTPPAGFDAAGNYIGAFKDQTDNWLSSPWAEFADN